LSRNLKTDIKRVVSKFKKNMSISLPVTQAVPTTNLVVTQAPKRSYKRKYSRRYKRYPRYLRRFRSARRMYPSSQYGYKFIPRSESTRSMYGETWRSATEAQQLARKTDGYFGRGAYGMKKLEDFLKKKKFGERLWGAGMGALIGGPEAAMMGFAGSGNSGRGLYTGRGAYNYNNLFDTQDQLRYGGPNDETETILINNCEYVQDIFGPRDSSFTNSAFNLNPGLQNNFPFISQIASNYTEYEFIQLVFEYRSKVDASSTNNPNGSTGNIMMCAVHDVTLPLIRSKNIFLGTAGAEGSRVVDNLIFGVECDPTKNAGSGQKFIRTNPVVSGKDPNTYDLGQMQLAIDNCPESFYNQLIGELWVSYTVKLVKPRIWSGPGSTIPEVRWLSGQPYAGGTTNMLGTASQVLRMQQNTFNVSLVCTPTTVPVLPSGTANGSLFTFTFPDWLTGVFEVEIRIGKTGTPFQPTTTVVPTASVSGTVNAYPDAYATGVPGTAGNYTPNGAMFIDGYSNSIYCYRFVIGPSVGGVDNTLSLGMSVNGTVGCCCVIMRQMNPQLRKPDSIGNDTTPFFVNSASNVVLIQ